MERPTMNGEPRNGSLWNRAHLTVAVVAIFLIASLSAASGSSRGGVTAGPSEPTVSDPFLITSVFKAVVVAVDEKTGKVSFRDLKTEKLIEVELTKDLELVARRKKDFDGRRQLQVADLSRGQLVKITVRDADGAVLQIRVESLSST